VIAISAAILALALGTPAAYAIARFRFMRWRNRDITVWFLSQRVLPPVATVIPFYLAMRWLGLLDTHLALILINATFIMPYVVVILRQTFLDLPVELEEAALTATVQQGVNPVVDQREPRASVRRGGLPVVHEIARSNPCGRGGALYTGAPAVSKAVYKFSTALAKSATHAELRRLTR